MLGIDARRIRTWLRGRYGKAPSGGWDIDESTLSELRAELNARSQPRQPTAPGGDRARDEHYVIDLCDELLGVRASRQHRFEWLVGDAGADGRPRQLPVDAYYESLALVIEYREQQHDRPVAFFDKPDRLTVSGVHRGEQRRMYDERRDVLIPQRGLRLWVVTPPDLTCDARGRLTRRDHDRDLESLRAAWNRSQ